MGALSITGVKRIFVDFDFIHIFYNNDLLEISIIIQGELMCQIGRL